MSANAHREAPVAMAILAILVLISGCAPALIKMEKEELDRLKSEGEIRAVHYPPASPFVSAVDPEPVHPIYIVVWPWDLWVRSPRMSRQVEELSLEDPVLRVMERFIPAVETALDLKNVRVIQEPIASGDLDQLRIAFGKGLLLDFKTIHWTIFTNEIRYSAQSRLVRLEDSKSPWQGVCDVRHVNPSWSWDDLMSAQGMPLKVKLNEAADICATQLVAQFLVEEKMYATLDVKCEKGSWQMEVANANIIVHTGDPITGKTETVELKNTNTRDSAAFLDCSANGGKGSCSALGSSKCTAK